MQKKGFTLIELLVVIAIIGILAAMVLVALGSARDKARDARIKGAISQIRSQAEVVFDNNNGAYNAPTDMCTADANITTLLADAVANGGTAQVCSATADGYAVSFTLNDGTTGYCADSTGQTYQSATAAAGAGVCTP